MDDFRSAAVGLVVGDVVASMTRLHSIVIGVVGQSYITYKIAKSTP